MKKQPLYFEDLKEGKILKTKPGKPISLKMIETYQKLTGETARSHADPVFAKQFGFKGIVVPGYLLEALASSLVRRDTPLEIVAQSETRNKFISPCIQALGSGLKAGLFRVKTGLTSLTVKWWWRGKSTIKLTFFAVFSLWN